MTTEMSNQMISEDYRKLIEYAKDKPEGWNLYYRDVEKATNVKMDKIGRTRLHKAIKRCGYECKNITNEGYQLASVENAGEISDLNVKRIANALVESEKTHKRLNDRFTTRLPKDVRDRLLMRESVVGAMISSRGLITGRKAIRQLTEGKPELPDGI